MGMPAILTKTGTGRSTLWMPDFFQDPFNIGIGCVIAGGPPTYNIEHTFDDPNGLVATFQGSITTTVLTVGVLYSGALAVGQVIYGQGVTPGTVISSLGTGSGGIGTYNITPSQSAPLGPMSSATQNWFVNSGINGAVANANGNYQFPVRAISINITGGSGSVTATFIQATFPR